MLLELFRHLFVEAFASRTPMRPFLLRELPYQNHCNERRGFPLPWGRPIAFPITNKRVAFGEDDNDESSKEGGKGGEGQIRKNPAQVQLQSELERKLSR